MLEAWQGRLGLGQWNLELEFDVEFESPTQNAEVRWDWSYDNATLELGTEWREWDNDRLQVVLVHELLHIFTRDLEVAVADAVDYFPLREKRHVRDRWQHEIEGVVDRLAVRLVDVGGLV